MKSVRRKRPVDESIRINDIWIVLPFFLVSLDAWINYFLTTLSASFRVGILAALALVVVVVKFDFKILRVSNLWLFLLGLLCLSLAIGIVSAPDIMAGPRGMEILGIVTYFFCGYVCFRWEKNAYVIQMMFLTIGTLYVTTCLVALLKVWPEFFPLIERLWSQQGHLRTRPEIMTDQNFQIFYLLPVALGFVMPLKPVRGAWFGALILGAVYILAQLQTRSGSIILFSVLVLGLAAVFRNGRMGRKKIMVIPVLAAAVVMLALPFILEHASLLIYRFIDMDYGTAIGRLQSALYLFEKIGDPNWWVPKGNGEFIARHGVLPHSNFTAFFLEGGLIGLTAALAIIAFPALWLVGRIVVGNLDPVAVAVGCAGAGVLALQLSLNVPTQSQVWLWAGAVIGVIERLRAEHQKMQGSVRIRTRAA